ncbi:hypothetical protein MTO96_034209 [Rhipicephalus appendiculatus]
MNPLEWRNVAIPLAADGQFSRRSCYEEPGDPNETRTVLGEEWDYYDGQVVVGIVAGSFADRVGRKPVILASAAILLVSTIAANLALNSYPLYLAARGFASCNVASACILIGIAFFEVTTQDNRPLHIVIIGALAAVTSDLWFGFVAPLDLHWVSKQAAYLAPTFLLATAFFQLSPTAVRDAVSGWFYGFGMLGALSAGVARSLQRDGREDLGFGIASGLMFASARAVRSLPQKTAVECAKISAMRSTVAS